MTFKEAIKKAIEGGLVIGEWHLEDDGYGNISYCKERILLDPLFWKAFFKAMKSKLEGGGCCAECYFNLFHKHIWKGGTIKSFFEKL